MQATHRTYTVVKTERAPPKRARLPAPPPKPSGAAAALLKSTFFLTAAEKRAAAQDPPVPAAAPAAEEAAPESEEAAAAPAPPPLPPPVPLEEPSPRVDAAPQAAGWSLLPSLQRAVMALVSEVRNLPVRVVEAMDAAAEKKKDMVAADRVKGSTLEEVIASTGLVRQDSYLICIQCYEHAPRLSGGRGGAPGRFNTARPLRELKVDIAKHYKLSSHAPFPAALTFAVCALIRARCRSGTTR